MSPPATLTLASPAVRPAVSVLMASARTGPAASVNPAADAADAVMKPRRDNGAALVRPTISCILVCIFIFTLLVGFPIGLRLAESGGEGSTLTALGEAPNYDAQLSCDFLQRRKCSTMRSVNHRRA